MKNLRYIVVIVVLAATAATFHARGDVDKVPKSDPLRLLPETIDSREGKDLPIDDDVLAVLGKGDFLNRMYLMPTGVKASYSEKIPIGLFIGYFPAQRTGQSIHSPQHCLPGAGWTFESSTYNNLTGTDGKDYRVGEYVINNGEARQFVVYWYQAHGRSVANDYAAKMYMIADAIRYNRTDGALVRVMSQIGPAETADDARERVIRFASKVAPMLSEFIPN